MFSFKKKKNSGKSEKRIQEDVTTYAKTKRYNNKSLRFVTQFIHSVTIII